MTAAIVLASVVANAGVSLREGVLPLRPVHFIFGIPVAPLGAVVVGQYKTAAMFLEKITQQIMAKPLMMDREVAMGIHADKGLAVRAVIR